MLIPGPMLAWARSTGATLPCCKFLSASGNSARRALRNWRRDATGASLGRGRQARTMDEARAFVLRPTLRLTISVRTGQVPVIVKPERIRPSNMVSQPVEAVTYKFDPLPLF